MTQTLNWTLDQLPPQAIDLIAHYLDIEKNIPDKFSHHSGIYSNEPYMITFQSCAKVESEVSAIHDYFNVSPQLLGIKERTLMQFNKFSIERVLYKLNKSVLKSVVILKLSDYPSFNIMHWILEKSLRHNSSTLASYDYSYFVKNNSVDLRCDGYGKIVPLGVSKFTLTLIKVTINQGVRCYLHCEIEKPKTFSDLRTFSDFIKWSVITLSAEQCSRNIGVALS